TTYLQVRLSNRGLERGASRRPRGDRKHCSIVGQEIPHASSRGWDRGGFSRRNSLLFKDLDGCHRRHIPSLIPPVAIRTHHPAFQQKRTPLDVKREPPKKTKNYIAWGAGLVV